MIPNRGRYHSDCCRLGIRARVLLVCISLFSMSGMESVILPDSDLGPGGQTAAAAESVKDQSSKVKDLTFDDIKLNMKKGEPFQRSMLTEKIEKLHGTSVRIRGYILPSFQQKGITQFVLVRDNMECCFGPGAALYDCILVEMASGKSTAYTVRPVAVQGKFEISEFKGPDGTHLAIYKLIGEDVK